LVVELLLVSKLASLQFTVAMVIHSVQQSEQTGHNNIQRQFSATTCTETLQYAHGRYTDATITRAGKIVGSLGAALDAAFHQQVCETDVDESYRRKHDYASDVRAFCGEYARDKLFDVIPGRQHRSFPAYVPRANIADPEALKRRLIMYSRKLDQCRLL